MSNSESDEAETADALQIEPVERWRSFSEGEQVKCMRQVFSFHPLESNASVFEAAGLLYRILRRNLNYRQFEGEWCKTKKC